MLNLDRYIVGDRGEFVVERLYYSDAVGGAVEKVGVAERDVLGAGFDLLSDIGQDDVALDDAECALIDGHYGAVAAEVFAASTGFGIAGDLGLAAR